MSNADPKDGIYVAKVTTNDPVVKQLVGGLARLPGTKVEVDEDVGPEDKGVNERLGKIRVIVRTEPSDTERYMNKTLKEIAAEDLPDPDPLLEASLVGTTKEPINLSEELKSIEEKYGDVEGKTLLQLVVAPNYMESDEEALQESIENGEIIEGEIHKSPLLERGDLGDLEIDEK